MVRGSPIETFDLEIESEPGRCLNVNNLKLNYDSVLDTSHGSSESMTLYPLYE